MHPWLQTRSYPTVYFFEHGSILHYSLTKANRWPPRPKYILVYNLEYILVYNLESMSVSFGQSKYINYVYNRKHICDTLHISSYN